MHTAALRTRLLLAALAALSGPAARAAEPTAPTRWTVSFTGFGPVRFGMTVREAGEAMKLKLEEDGPNRRCHFAGNDGQLPGVSFMVIDGQVVRVDVQNISNRTDEGAGVGVTESWLKKVHAKIKVERHPREAGGHYFILPAGDGRHALLFETDGQAVTSFRAGWIEPLALIDGCR